LHQLTYITIYKRTRTLFMEKIHFSSSSASSDAYAQYDGHYLPPRRRGLFRSLFGWFSGLLSFILATILFFTLMTLAIYWLVCHVFIPPGDLKTPDLRGKPFLEAAKVLRNQNLSIKWERDQPNETVQEGNIITQKPEPGTPIKKGSSIRVVVSGGLALVPLPDLRRVTQNRAQILLRKAGLEVGNRTLLPSTTDPVGTVLATDPPAGTGVPQGSKINLLVATGQGQMMQAMPNLAGMTLDQAREVLTKAGLFATELPVSAEGAAPGQVVSQNPPAGESVTDSTRIVVKYTPTVSEEGSGSENAADHDNAATSESQSGPGVPEETTIPAVTLPSPGEAKPESGETRRSRSGSDNTTPADLEGAPGNTAQQ
jgi:beta-lactam-binding protein with PASTA domain